MRYQTAPQPVAPESASPEGRNEPYPTVAGASQSGDARPTRRGQRGSEVEDVPRDVADGVTDGTEYVAEAAGHVAEVEQARTVAEQIS